MSPATRAKKGSRVTSQNSPSASVSDVFLLESNTTGLCTVQGSASRRVPFSVYPISVDDSFWNHTISSSVALCAVILLKLPSYFSMFLLQRWQRKNITGHRLQRFRDYSTCPKAIVTYLSPPSFALISEKKSWIYPQHLRYIPWKLL